VFVVTVRRTNTILYTDRWADTVAFYRDAMSLPIEFENGWFVEFALATGTYVSVADADRASIASGRGDGLTLSLQVDDVDAVRTELIGAGVDVGDVGRRWGADVLDVWDPSGNRVELWAERGDG
jgi:catechol 2,3-dioxygenase-like lactoylglutathione lyase family enzyme